jgi:hypothetical protein
MNAEKLAVSTSSLPDEAAAGQTVCQDDAQSALASQQAQAAAAVPSHAWTEATR